VLLCLPASVLAEDAGSFYNKNCGACHTIGGGSLLGPDLKGVGNRKDRKWLAAFLVNPESTLNAGDPYGKKILAEANGMVMPQVEGIDPAMANRLLDWIDAQSQGGTSQTIEPATVPAEVPFTSQDAAHGRGLVLGNNRLKSGGPACVGCHLFRDSSGAVGGALGPDLTAGFVRLGGKHGVMGWLSAPPTPTMRAIYKDHPLAEDETFALAAYFDSLSRQNETPSRGRLMFFGMGTAGCLAALVLMDAAWKKRFTAVRRPLVKLERKHR
jgi:mono/diheme cytochrome c family protein